MIKTFWKIFKKSFNLDQSQVCISNGLEARALQREALFSENAFLYRDCETEMGNVFTQTNASLASNESTFKGLSDDLWLSWVSFIFIGTISYAKVRLFFWVVWYTSPRDKFMSKGVEVKYYLHIHFKGYEKFFDACQ